MTTKLFEEASVLNSGIDAYFITIIPKVKDLINLTEYRPINIIGCVSKIISKMLVERLKVLID